MNTQIVDIDCTVPVTCVEIVGADTDMYEVDAWAVYIKKYNPYEGYKVLNSCGQPLPHWNSPCDPCPEPMLMYKVHEISDDGKVCFHWDGLLYSQCPGRYNAVVKDKHGVTIGKFMITLTRRRSYVKSAICLPMTCC